MSPRVYAMVGFKQNKNHELSCFVAFEIDENEYVFMDSTAGTVRFFDDVFGFYETVYSSGNVVPFYEIKKYNETVIISNENW